MVVFTKKNLPGDISLPNMNNRMYTVTRDESTSTYKFLGLRLPLSGDQFVALEDVTDECHLFLTQIMCTKCDKTSCLNAFITSFIPFLAYKMITTQFTELMWNKAMVPEIRAISNATGIRRRLWTFTLPSYWNP